MSIISKLKSACRVFGAKSQNDESIEEKQYYYYNWWYYGGGFWLDQFITHRFKYTKPVIFMSCFREKKAMLKSGDIPKIFYTPENIRSAMQPYREAIYGNHLLDEVDLALGFEFRTEPNYYRFPIWIVEKNFIKPTDGLDEIKSKIARFNDPKFRISATRDRFAAQISRHDWSGSRTQIIDLLSPIGQIDCAGLYRHNTDELQDKYNNVKADFLANYKFNICPENTLGEGYITEKVFESIASGCIPIYWGAYLEPGILNPDAILRYEEGKEQELYDKVKLLWENEDEYRKFIEIPPFVDGAAERIWEMIQGLESRLSEILK